MWLNEVGLELPRASEGGSLKKIRQLADVGRFLNRLLGRPINTVLLQGYSNIIGRPIITVFIQAYSNIIGVQW